ncbi:MFS transporter [Psychrobacter raelei]|uniref:MFS transporter n=1 Tax=Psychrobacter raelei TaxID=2565531 RepID=UPI003F5EE80A
MKSIVLKDFIDSRALGNRQKSIIALCMALMILDGYDIQAMAYAAPLIISDWQIDKTMLGVVFSSSLVGLFFGSLLISNLSDRFGRRIILLISTLLFSIFMLVTPMAHNLEQLAILRFVTGIFLGGIMPNAMAYCAEIVPSKYRVFTMIMISSGFTIGAMLGGFVATWLKAYGWQAIFYFGGIVPLILFVVMFMALPESLQFLASKPNNESKIKSILQRFYPSATISNETTIILPKNETVKASPIELFKENRSFFTITIWIASMMNLMSLYFLSSWLPTLGMEAGLTTTQALMIGSTLQFGGTVGSLLMGTRINKLGFYKVLIPIFIVAALSVAMIGFSAGSIVVLFIVVFIAGFTVVGGQPTLNALSAERYPTLLRTTGVGWSLGIGRIGSMIGPVIGGLLSKSLTLSTLFLFAAVPSIVVVIMMIMQARHPGSKSEL